MNHDPKIDRKLKEKLASYQVDVPDFPMKGNRWERFISLLASPAKNPLERLTVSMRGIATLGSIPLASAVMISILQMLIFFM